MAVPWERLLVDTDAPDIMPAIGGELPPKGAVNEPANLVHMIRSIAEIRKVPESEVAERTWENACRLFGEG